MVKNLPAMQKTRVGSLGQEDPQEKGIATYSSILAWRIPRTEEPGRLQSMGSQESDTTERLNHHHQENWATLHPCRNPKTVFPFGGKEAAASRRVLIYPSRTVPLTFSKAPQSRKLFQGFPSELPPGKKKNQ